MGRSVYPIAGQRGVLAWIFWKEDFRTRTWQVLTQRTPNGWRRGFWWPARATWWELCDGEFFFEFLESGFLPGTFRLSFVGLFFNHFLVGAWGRRGESGLACRQGSAKTAALLSVIMDRTSGFGASDLVFAYLHALAFFDWLMRSPVVAGLMHAVFSIFCALIALVVFFRHEREGTYSPIAVRLPGPQDNHRVYRSVFSVCQLLEADLAGVAAFGGDVAGLFLDFYFSARAFGLEVPWANSSLLCPQWISFRLFR